MFFIDSQTPYHSCHANLHLKYISVAELNTGYSDGAKFYPTSLAVHKHYHIFLWLSTCLLLSKFLHLFLSSSHEKNPAIL